MQTHLRFSTQMAANICAVCVWTCLGRVVEQQSKQVRVTFRTRSFQTRTHNRGRSESSFCSCCCYEQQQKRSHHVRYLFPKKFFEYLFDFHFFIQRPPSHTNCCTTPPTSSSSSSHSPPVVNLCIFPANRLMCRQLLICWKSLIVFINYDSSHSSTLHESKAALSVR